MKKISFIIILSTCILGPMGNDMFISSMPEMKSLFNTNHIQWFMSVYLIGLAAPQLVVGGLIDQFGKKNILLISLLIFSIASICITMTNNYFILLIIRFVQAIGASAIIPCIISIAKTTYKNNKQKLVTVISFIMLGISLIPILAPSIGAWLQFYFNWTATFFFLFLLSCFYIILIKTSFKEKQNSSTKFDTALFLNNYKTLLKNRQFMVYSITTACSYAILFSFLGSATLIYSNQYHVSPLLSGNLIGVNGLSLLLTGALAPYFSKKLGIDRSVRIATYLLLFGGALLAIFNTLFINDYLVIVISMLITSLGIGIIRPLAQAGAIHIIDEKMTGSAVSLMNFLTFGFGFTINLILGFIHNIDTSDLSLVNIILAVSAVVLMSTITQKKTLHEDA